MPELAGPHNRTARDTHHGWESGPTPGLQTGPVQIELAVRSERIRTLYRQVGAILITNVLNACIVGAVLWNSAPKHRIVAWVIAISGVSLVRFWRARAYHSAPPLASEANRWGAWFVVGSATTGALWGAASYWLLEGSTATGQLVVVFVVGGMCAAAAGTIASHLPAYAAFTLLALAGLALRMVQIGDAAHTVLATMIAIYAVALSIVARVNNRVLSEAFTLRFENERLIGELRLAQERLAETNRTLELRVTERTEALRAQSERLRNAERMEAVGRLAGGVAHDFNNLLTVILANLGELITRRPSKHESAVALNEIREAANKGADLVRQLLMFSRQQRTIPQTLDLNGVLHALTKPICRLIGERHTLQLNLHASELPVRLDPAQIKQVVINLVTNARDAMKGGGVITITTGCANLEEPRGALESGSYAVLTVADTGSGMDSKTQQLIFDPFFTTKDVDKGTGLGLATVYGIVQQSGGEVRVTSELDRGSTFEICLPLAGVDAYAPEATPSTARASEPVELPPKTPAATILLVEDEPFVRKVTRRMLTRAGFRVLTAENSERALRISANHTGLIDVLVTDVIMPGMDGAQLAELLCHRRPGIRTLFMSGYSRGLAVPEDDPVRGTTFLAKPFTNEALIAKVTELLIRPAAGMHTSAA